MINSFKILEIEGMKKYDVNEIEKKFKAMEEKYDIPIDKKILPLVIGLNVWGIETVLSCEGHQDVDERFRFPWIQFPWEYLGRVARLLLMWNYRDGKKQAWHDNPNAIMWGIEINGSPRIRPLLPGPSLEVLKKDAVEFGFFLQKIPKDQNWT